MLRRAELQLSPKTMGDARGSKVKSKQGPEMGAKERRRAKKSPVGSGWRRVLSMFPNTTWV